MNLTQASLYAVKIKSWLAPHCEWAEIAGSVRRGRPVCNDVDLVVVPVIREERDMLGDVVSRVNACVEFVRAHIAASQGRASLRSGAGDEPEIMSVYLPKVQLDIFFATKATWASRLLCRTGSAAHNIHLVERAKSLGLQWKPMLGIVQDGKLLPAESEEDIFRMLQMDYVPPEKREI